MSAIAYTAQDTSFRISIYGLRPLTTHTCYFDSAVTTSVKPLYGKYGDPLVSDPNGELVFDFYYGPPLPKSASSREEFARLLANIVGTKVLKVVDASTLSSARVSITVSADCTEDIRYAAPPPPPPPPPAPVVAAPPPPPTSPATIIPPMPRLVIRGGGGGSVSEFAFMPFTELRAGQLEPGALLMLLHESRESVTGGRVISNRISEQNLLTLVSSSGIRLTLSDNTPITLRDGSTCNSTEVLGKHLPVYSDNGGFRWEEIVEVLEAGRGNVATIYCDNQCYAAGDEPGKYIITHNILWAKH